MYNLLFLVSAKGVATILKSLTFWRLPAPTAGIVPSAVPGSVVTPIPILDDPTPTTLAVVVVEAKLPAVLVN